MTQRYTLPLLIVAMVFVMGVGTTAADGPGPHARHEVRPGGSPGMPWAPGTCTQLLQDGSFEAGTPSAVWEEYSENFFTPLCTIADCGDGNGTAGPHTGSWWAWFGGIDAPETAYVSQTLTIPSGAARLSFYLWIGTTDMVPTDFVQARIDDTAVFTATGDQQPTYATYTLVELNVDAYADGMPHVVQFYSYSGTAQVVTNFSLDDAVLCTLLDPTPTSTPTPTNTPTATPTPSMNARAYLPVITLNLP